jgi:hypothetical protein
MMSPGQHRLDAELDRVMPGGGRAVARSLAVAVCGLALLAQAAIARPFRPPHHRAFHGVSDTGHVKDFRVFKHRVRAHPATLESFSHWDGRHTTSGLRRWDRTDTRGVLSLSTAAGGQPERITPRKIADGWGDDYILRLNESIATSHQVVYLRLFPEMNGHWNPYCAFNANGTSRGASHSTANFRKAWRRITLIVRGGEDRSYINRKLLRLGMPRIYRASSNHDPVYRRKEVPKRLPGAKVALMWNPQTIGSPAVAGNAAGNYWPGHRYVDWVGADISSKFATPGIRAALTSFYRRWDRWPFLLGEYSPWDNDYSGDFTRWLFNWAQGHGRTRMLIYYRSVSPNNAFDINHWPAARRVIRHRLNKHLFDPFAPATHD